MRTHRLLRPFAPAATDENDKPKYSRAQQLAAGATGLAAAATSVTVAIAGVGSGASSASPADVQTVLDSKPAAVCVGTAPSNVLSGTTADGRTWRAVIDDANRTASANGALSPAQTTALCQVDAAARSDAFTQNEALSGKPSDAQQETAAAKRRADAVTIAAVQALFAHNLDTAGGTVDALSRDATARATEGAFQTGPKRVADWQAVERGAAQLAAQRALLDPRLLAAEQGVLDHALSKRELAATLGAFAGGKGTVVVISQDEAGKVSVRIDRAASAAKQQARGLEQQLLTDLTADFARAEVAVPQEVLQQARAALEKGTAYQTVAAQVLLAFRGTPGAFEADWPGLAKQLAGPVADLTFGAGLTPEQQAVAKAAYQKGASDADVVAAVLSHVKGQPWAPSKVEVKLAPAGMSERDQYNYYLRLVNSVGDVRVMGDKPIFVGLRGLGLDGSHHETRNVNAYDDALVILHHGQVTLVHASTHPTQTSTSPEYGPQGRVGIIKPGIYALTPHGRHQGAGSLLISQMSPDGTPGSMNDPALYDLGMDGSYGNDHPVASGEFSFGNWVLIHIGGGSTMCTVVLPGDYSKVNPFTDQNGYYAVLDANA
ncbi:MAG: hypothetical protein IPJ65_35155 [Archangiaceae bacterium]|nr:hypothetical protein [Archangiaceae bacterium]